MKRIFSLLLAVLMCFSMMYVASSAEEDMNIIAEQVEVKYGVTEVEVDITIPNNPGIALIGFDVAYDSDVFTLTSATLGDIFTGELECNLSKVPFTFNVYTGSGNKTASGTLVTLKFSVAEGCELGTYDIKISKVEALNFDEEDVAYSVTDGYIKIKGEDFTGITFKDTTYTYDGTEKELKVTGTLPEGASVEYKDNKGTDVGTYEASAKVTKDGYNDLTLYATLKITPATLKITGMTIADKVYDGTVDAEISEGTLTGVAEGDDVTAVYPEKGTFASKDAKSTAIAVTVDEITLDGEDAGNYTLTQPTGLKAKISKAPVTITADSFELTVGDDLPELTYTVTSGEVYEEDAITGALSTTATTAKAGTYSVTKGTLKVSSNYTLETFVNGTITVTEKPVQEVSVAKLEEVVYGEFPFALEVTLGEKVTDSEVIYSSSNENVAEISEDGVITVKNAGETEITVSKAGNEEYAAFVYKQTLKVNKAVVVVNAVENQWKRVGEEDPELAYTYNNTLIDGDVFTGALTRKTGETAGLYDILIGTLKVNDNYEIIFNGAKFEIKAKLAQDVEYPGIETKSYSDDDFALDVVIGDDASEGEMTYASSNESVATVSADGVVTIKGVGYTYITVTKAGDADYLDYSGRQKLTVSKANITVNADEDLFKRVGTEDPELTYTYEGTLEEGDAFTGKLTRRSGETVGLYDILIGTLKLNDNYKITFNSAKFEIADKFNQVVTVSEITEKTYGDEDFTLTVEEGEGTTSEVVYASSNDSVATITADGVITIVGAGETEITVSKAGNDDYKDFVDVQTLKVNKIKVAINVTAGQSKKIGTEDPEFTYTYEGTLKAGDEFTGKLSRVAGEAVGLYDITIGNLAITNGNNYDVTFVGAKFEITEKTIQTITVAVVPGFTYGDAPYTLTVTGDAESGLSAFTYESDNTDVVTVADGVITIVGAGSATVTVKEPGNDEYAAASYPVAITVAKKDVTVDAVDVEGKTATITGMVGEDEITLDFDALKVELIAAEADSATVKVTNFVLSGNKAANYNVTTESINTEVGASLLADVAVSAENGTVEGAGTYIIGSSVTLKAVPASKYKFTGWYEGTKLISSKAEYTFVIEEDKELIAKFKKKSTGGGGGGGGTSYNTVTFNTDGGSTVANAKIESGKTLGEIAEPTKEGFIFEGWFLDKEFTTEVSKDSTIKSNMTLYAKWVSIATKQITLTIDEKKATAFGEEKENDVAPIIRNDRTMLPARFVAEALGAEVSWNAETRVVTITKDDVVIVITIDSDKATISGKEVTLDSPAFIENDRTYTPVRFVAEALGAEVSWDEETRKVTITVK